MQKYLFSISLFFLTCGMASFAFAQSNTIYSAEKRIAKLEGEVKALQRELVSLKKSSVTLKTQTKSRKVIEENGLTVLQAGFMPIVSSPYQAGVNVDGVQLDPNGLIVTFPAYNQDWALLKQRQDLGKIGTKQGIRTDMVQISGMVEAQVTGWRNPDGSSSSDIDLSEAELHLNADIHPWVMGFFSVAFDNTALPNTTSRLNNSSLFLDRAFITIGNLDQAPVYMTVGQRFVAFGHYDNYMATAPLTRLLGRVRARQISLSYQHPQASGMYATAFAFKGDTQIRSSQHINQWGGTLGYEFKNGSFKTDIGADYINNLADSEGMMALAFNQNSQLVKRVPGIALHAKIGVGPYLFIMEYIGALTPFDPSNMSFNDSGARPQALDTAFVYTFNSWNKPSDFTIGYAQTRQALALFMPEQRFAMNYNIVMFKDTILSLEYYRDYNYAAANRATAQGALRTLEGGFSDTVTGMLTYYF